MTASSGATLLFSQARIRGSGFAPLRSAPSAQAVAVAAALGRRQYAPPRARPPTPSSSSPPGTRRRAARRARGVARAELPDADVLVIDDGSTDGDRRGRARARRRRRLLRREPRAARGDRRGLPRGARARLRVLRAASTPTASIPPTSCDACSSSSRADECDVAVGSRFASGEGTRRTATRRRRAPLRHVAAAQLDARPARAPFHDATSGMYAVNRDAHADPGAALHERGAGGRGAAAPAATPGCGSSRCRSTCASARTASRSSAARRPCKLVLTVVGTLLFFRGSEAFGLTAHRVVVVLGYSLGAGRELHPVCRAAERARRWRPATTSWCSRAGRGSRTAHSEAELMHAAWHGPLARSSSTRTRVPRSRTWRTRSTTCSAWAPTRCSSSRRRGTPRARRPPSAGSCATRASRCARPRPPGGRARRHSGELALWPLLPFQLWVAGRKSWKI